MNRLTCNYVASILLSFMTLACATSSSRPNPFPRATRVDFEDANGRVSVRLEPGTQGIRVEGRGGKVLAIIRNGGEHLEVVGAGGESLWHIEAADTGNRRFKVRNTAGGSTVFVLKRDPDGDIKIDAGTGPRVAVLKLRDYGYKLVSGEGKSLVRIRSSSAKISMRDPSGRTYLSSRDPFPVEAAAIFAVEVLPVELAAGLAAAVAFWRPEVIDPPGETTRPAHPETRKEVTRESPSA